MKSFAAFVLFGVLALVALAHAGDPSSNCHRDPLKPGVQVCDFTCRGYKNLQYGDEYAPNFAKYCRRERFLLDHKKGQDSENDDVEESDDAEGKIVFDKCDVTTFNSMLGAKPDKIDLSCNFGSSDKKFLRLRCRNFCARTLKKTAKADNGIMASYTFDRSHYDSKSGFCNCKYDIMPQTNIIH